MRYLCSTPFGHTKRQLRKKRDQLQLRGLIDIHHIIPREFKNHPTLKKNRYDVEESYNLMFMPRRVAVYTMTLRENRPLHDVNHSIYNDMVGNGLCIYQNDGEFLWFLLLLHKICRGRIRSKWSSEAHTKRFTKS